MKSLIKANNEGGILSNEKIWQAVIDLRAELNVEYKHNINNISCNDLYQSPMKKKDVWKINDSVYYESDEHVNMISDSSKQVDASNEPIKETHIVYGINNLSVGVVSVKPAVIRIGIIGQGITQGVINGERTLTATLSLTSWQILARYSLTRIRFNSIQFNLRRSWLDCRTNTWKATIWSYERRVIVEKLGGNISVGLIPQEWMKTFGV